MLQIIAVQNSMQSADKFAFSLNTLKLLLLLPTCKPEIVECAKLLLPSKAHRLRQSGKMCM